MEKNNELAKKVLVDILNVEKEKLDVIKEYIIEKVKESVLSYSKIRSANDFNMRDKLCIIPNRSYDITKFKDALNELGFKLEYEENIDVAISFPNKHSDTEAGKLAAELEKEVELYYKNQNKMAEDYADRFFKLVNNIEYDYDIIKSENGCIEYVKIIVIMPISTKDISPQFKYEVKKILEDSEFLDLYICYLDSEISSWEVKIYKN